ncbi:MAG TPA: hypothetical protein VEW74_04700 [Candidatus Nitrosotalea sp.]|nr:hypothetical protein [Candidatus Nitrosotalea sp.]
MTTPDNEPNAEELEKLRDDEERRLLERPDVPDDVKAEVIERLERFEDEELEDEIEDEPPPDRRRP